MTDRSSTVVELLLKNDDHYRWLSLTNNDIGVPMSELTTALLQNHSLRKISIHAGFLASLSQDDLLALLSALSQLNHIQDLWLALPIPSSRQQQQQQQQQQHQQAQQPLAANPTSSSVTTAICRSSEVLETLLLNNNNNKNTNDKKKKNTNNTTSSSSNNIIETSGRFAKDDMQEEEMDTTNQDLRTTGTSSSSSLQLHKLTIRGMDDAGCRVLARALRQQPPKEEEVDGGKGVGNDNTSSASTASLSDTEILVKVAFPPFA